MNDPESNPPELSRAEEDAVRRHLAEARHTDPMPDAVAERLDRVLVGLAEERTPTRSVQPEVRPVTDLAARRRRRGVQLLVAAAAVVVAGVAFNQLAVTGSEDDAQPASTAEDAGSGEAFEAPADGGDKSGAASEEHEQDRPSSEPTTLSGGYNRLPVVRPDHFRADVAEYRNLTRMTSAYVDGRAERKALGAGCPVAAKGERGVVVTYAGALAELVYRVPTDLGQRVDLYRCEGGDDTGFVRSVVLPSP